MRIRLAVPDELDDQERKEALNHALEAVTIANTGLIKRGLVPTAAKLIKAGVRWKPEPPGDEHFDLGTTVAKRGWGDCDDLAPLHAASLRATGRDPQARAVVKRSGPKRWHAYVVRGDGSKEDPSRAAGMGHNVSGDGGGAHAPIHHPMCADPRLCIAVRGTPGNRWFARVDVPDRSAPWSWTSLSHATDPRTALQAAVKSARQVVGEEIDEEDDYRLAIVNDLVAGADPYQVREALAEHIDDPDDVMRLLLDGVHSVGFLDAITRPLRKLAAPVTRAIDKVSPYAAPLFPHVARIVDPVRTFIETGDPAAAYKQVLIPGSRSGRDFFERNPAGRAVYAPLRQAFGNIPGASTWFNEAAPRPPQRPGTAPLPPGGGQAFDPREMLAMLYGQAGNAPMTQTFERGAVAQPFEGGPSFMRF